MAWRFLRSLAGRRRHASPDASADGAAGGADAEPLLLDLLQRLPEPARPDYEAELRSLRDVPPAGRTVPQISLYCRIEDQLAGLASHARVYRTDLRKGLVRRWPQIAAQGGDFALLLLPPDRQEIALCLRFLRAAMAGARDILGAAGGNRIGELARWLDVRLERDVPPPFVQAVDGRGTGANAIDPIRDCSRAFYAWLQQTLGARATVIYEKAYREAVATFGAADGFPVVLNLLPPPLLSADKISLLRRSQVEHVLTEKILELERANAAIQEARDTLEQRVHERTEQLAAANQAKSEFLAMVSHELRTPLNAIIGFSHMISDQTLGPINDGRYVDYARHIRDSGAHLLSIINDILEIERLIAGRLELAEERLSIDRVVDAALTLVGPNAEAAGVRLINTVSRGLPSLRADRRMLIQILLNLLGNSIKFTPRGGTVRIDAGLRRDGDLILEVQDSGIGIAPEDLKLVLEPFRQVRNPNVAGHPGSGLGLPIAVGLAHLHGGDLELRSRPGAGTTAIVRFPADRLLAADAVARETASSG